MRAYRVLIPTLTLLAAATLATSGLAQAEPAGRIVPASAIGLKQSFAPVVRRAAPAVVNISSKRMVRQQVDPFWQLFGMGAPRNRVEGSLGSGVIVRSDGVIVTNNHVVEGGQEITVALADRREFPAKVLLADPRTDLAILKIDLPAGEKLPVLAIDERTDSQVGDLVLAIGDPLRCRPDGDQRDHLRAQPHRRSERRRRRLHPDRRGDQPGQLRRRAGGHGRAP